MILCVISCDYVLAVRLCLMTDIIHGKEAQQKDFLFAETFAENV